MLEKVIALSEKERSMVLVHLTSYLDAATNQSLKLDKSDYEYAVSMAIEFAKNY